MRPSFKTTTLIAAIGMIVFTLYVTARYIIQDCGLIHYHYSLGYDIRVRLIYDILPVSLIIAGIGLWNNRPAEAMSKSFRVFTTCLLISLVGTLVFSPLYAFYIAGMKYLMPSIYWRAFLLISGIIWLFMLRNQPVEEASPRSYQVTLIVATLALAFPFVLEIASGISCLCSGLVLSLSSGTIQSWVNYIAPIMILTHFVFPQLKAINTTRNSHCTPGSDAERTFKRNRKITLIAAGSAIVFLCLGYVAFYVSKRFHHPGGMDVSIFEYIAFFDYCFAFFAFLISWIMLSIMAFRQLPNPFGYKIFNIVCQVLTWGSLLTACLVPNSVDETFIIIFFLSFAIFFVITAIRVISYSLPEDTAN